MDPLSSALALLGKNGLEIPAAVLVAVPLGLGLLSLLVLRSRPSAPARRPEPLPNQA